MIASVRKALRVVNSCRARARATASAARAEQAITNTLFATQHVRALINRGERSAVNATLKTARKAPRVVNSCRARAAASVARAEHTITTTLEATQHGRASPTNRGQRRSR